MRIGILTYHCVPNFGAQLQTLSTVQFLKKRGYEVIILNWYPKDLEELYAYRVSKEQLNAHELFMNLYLPVTDICRTEDDLIHQIDILKIQAVFVGSDALFKYVPWINRVRPVLNNLFGNKKYLSIERLTNNPFFGGFLSKTKMKIDSVAFSVSSQNCAYKRMAFWESRKMRKALANYKWISVRDEWTKEMIESLLDIHNIKVTPDPVFSFNQNCEELIFSRDMLFNKFNIDKNYILISFGKHNISEDYLASLTCGIKSRGYIPVMLPMPEGHYFDIDSVKKIDVPLDPLDWYLLIKYSKGYIGERMHPIVVCLHNSVPFFSYDEYGIKRASMLNMRKDYISDSSKTYQIIKRFNLLDYMYSYQNSSNLPTAEAVLDKLENFDRTTCAKNAIILQKEYVLAMEYALSILS